MMNDDNEQLGISTACARLEAAMHNFDASGSGEDYDDAANALKILMEMLNSIQFSEERQ